MAVGMYIRVSDEKQEDGISLEMQEDEIMKYAAYKGYDNIKKYSDVASARTVKKRLKFNELLKDVREGRIKKVVIYKLDRLTRSLRDLMNILHLLDKHECELHSTIENIDTSTPSGRMLVQVLGMIAEWESANTSERVSTSMQKFARKGIWLSSVPFGFDRDEDRKLIHNELEASILREAVEMVFDGNSFRHTEQVISDKYKLKWTDGYLVRKIREATMIGNIYRNGKLYENTHEGIITKEEQEKLIEIINENMTTNRGLEHNDIFRRRVVCYECNSIKWTQVNSSNDYATVSYSYKCGNCQRQGKRAPFVSENKLMVAFVNYMQNLKVDGLNELHQDDDSTKKIKELESNLNKIDKERDRIQRAWIKELISDDDLKKYQDEWDEEKEKTEKELEKLQGMKPITKEELKNITDLFKDHFEILDRDEKRAFVQRHVKAIHYSRKKVEGYQKKYNIRLESVEFF